MTAPSISATTLAPAEPGEPPPQMSRFTLRFPPELERAFREHHFVRSLGATRLLLLVGTTLYGVLFVAIDYAFMPVETFLVNTAIRLPIAALLVGLLVASYTKAFARWWQLVMASAIVLVTASICLMVITTRDPNLLAGLASAFLLNLMITFTVARLRLAYATVAGVLLVVIYQVTVRITGGIPEPTVTVHSMTMLSAVLLGVSAAYLLERALRNDFLSNLLLERERTSLQQANELLERRNRELARSREQVMRSARRTELVFLALTDALPGTVLDDRYRIEEKIGTGAFGTVYRATHLQLGTDVAVKVLRPYQGQDEIGVLERLRQEGVSVWRLRHPNIVAVLDFSVAHDAVAYLVMELLVGRSLAQELESGEQMSLRRTAEIMVPVCRALAEAHAQGIVHRDIKPSNVFLHRSASGETVKLIDFGIAKVLDEELKPTSDRRTATGLLLGTPTYFAPERLSGEPYGGAVDVYAVGVTLYEMLAGRLPFPVPSSPAGDRDWIAALMRLTQQPQPLRDVRQDIPAELDAMIQRAIALEPDDRPSARELGELLELLLRDNAGDDRTDSRAAVAG